MKVKTILPLFALAGGLIFLASVSGCVAPGGAGAGRIVAHPDALQFSERPFTPPQPEDYRRILRGGTVVYLVEDHDFPLININVTIRTGSYLEPVNKVGLAALVGEQMRLGGTTNISAEELEEEVAFLAAAISSGIGATQGRASAECLSKDLDRVLELFFDMLRNPAFQQDRLDLSKARRLQSMRRRNDSTGGIESREWVRLMRGEDHFSSLSVTQPTLESITREDLLDFHRRYYRPEAFIFAISGDFDTEDMLARLERYLGDWEGPDEPVAPVPRPSHIPKPGIYMVDKPDVNQGRLSVGHLGATRDNPDRSALMIMNSILGGGGFNSRLMQRVRTEEGLAYQVASSFGLGVYYEGYFRAYFQSRSESCAQALSIVLEEIDRIRTEKVSDDELSTAVNSIAESFPQAFSTPRSIVNTFAADEYTGRDADYWNEFTDAIRAVTAEDVLRVARRYLEPERLVIVAVGNVEDMLAGDADHPEFSFEKLGADMGELVLIPLPDPMTLVYPPTD